MTAEQNHVWYFAYGSNINEKVFCGRRGCKPLDKKLAVLPGWRLIFNLRTLPFFEPAMANVEPITNREALEEDHPLCVHGVAYKLTEKDFDEMYKTEGDGRSGSYAIVNVQLKAYDGTVINASTLSVPPAIALSRRDFAPSKRYRNLIVDGSKQEGIDEKYIAWLEKHAYLDRAILKQEHPHVWRFSFAFATAVIPVLLAVFIPNVLVAKIPFFTRRVRRVVLFPLDILFSVSARFFWGLHDGIVGTFGDAHLNELLCSAHMKTQ